MLWPLMNVPASLERTGASRLKAVLKWLVGGGVVLAAALQLTNPALTNPPVVPGHDVLATHPPPPEVATLLRSACYDCHSDETQWPWYSHVAPVSWWLDHHVKDARKKLNFSEWPNDDPQRAAKKWNRVSEEVISGDMPLPSYARIHPMARLNAGQREQLSKWADQEARRLQPDAARP
jgi:hypothetical protein